MSRGGWRDGAGRKLGSVNRVSLQAREAAAKTGELPHELLLRVSRGEAISEHTPDFAQRVDAAKAAAPYFAPRLACAHVDLTQNGLPDWLQPAEGIEAQYMSNCQLYAAIISAFARDKEDWEAFCWDKAIVEAISSFSDKRMPGLMEEMAQLEAEEAASTSAD